MVDDKDVAELVRRQPTAKVVGVEGAGHSIQGDRPLELAAILSEFFYPEGWMQRRVWLSRRALKLHAVVLIVVPAFMALCIWQVHRALDGNSLSWAYVFEWPLFAAYALYMWWRFLHEKPEPLAAATPSENGHAPPQPAAGVGPGRRRPSG